MSKEYVPKSKRRKSVELRKKGEKSPIKISKDAAFAFVSKAIEEVIPFKVFIHRPYQEHRIACADMYVRPVEAEALSPYGLGSPHEKLRVFACFSEDEQNFTKIAIYPYDEEWNTYAQTLANELVKYIDELELYLWAPPGPLARAGRISSSR